MVSLRGWGSSCVLCKIFRFGVQLSSSAKTKKATGDNLFPSSLDRPYIFLFINFIFLLVFRKRQNKACLTQNIKRSLDRLIYHLVN